MKPFMMNPRERGILSNNPFRQWVVLLSLYLLTSLFIEKISYRQNIKLFEVFGESEQLGSL